MITYLVKAWVELIAAIGIRVKYLSPTLTPSLPGNQLPHYSLSSFFFRTFVQVFISRTFNTNTKAGTVRPF